MNERLFLDGEGGTMQGFEDSPALLAFDNTVSEPAQKADAA